MSGTFNLESDPDQPVVYQIRTETIETNKSGQKG